MNAGRARAIAGGLFSRLDPRGAPALDPRPFALALTAGVLLIHSLPALPPLWACALLALPALLPWRGRLVGAGFALGVLLSFVQAQLWLDTRWPESRQGEERSVQGRIASLATRDGIAVHFAFEPDRTLPDQAELPPRIRAGWYRGETVPRAGECWRLQLRLRAPRGSANPGGFDYEAWLYRQGIGALATVRGGEPCGAASSWSMDAWREALRAQFERWLPGEPGRPLMQALTVGDQSELRDEDWDAFRLTGTSHLVAVSGFNVAIVAAVVWFPLRWLWSLLPWLCLRVPAQRAASIGAAITAVAYALLAGLEAPVARATAMVVLALLASLLTRKASLSRLFALAWIAVLLGSPAAVLSPGVWLSFGAVAVIAWVSAARVGRSEPVREGLRVQLALSLALAPLGLYFFAGLSWIAPLVNLVAVPLVAVLTPLLLGCAVLAWLWPAVGIVALGTSTEVVWRLQESLAWIAQHAPQPWIAASPPPLALLLAAIGMLLLLLPRGIPLQLVGLALLVPMFAPRAPDLAQGYRLTALDVGQGLAVVVRTPHHAVLFDAGPAFDEGFDAGSSVVAPYLLQDGVRQLDLMIISHGDLDHRGGAPAVRRLLSPREEWGALSDVPCRDGQHWIWDDVDFRVLHPDDGAWSRNNGGCVLRVEWQGHVALLPADIEAPAERRLLATHADLLGAELLIAPHHGSKSSSIPPFVEAVLPDTVIYADAFANSYHLPARAIVGRYADSGAQALQTGLSGAVSWTVTDSAVALGIERSQTQRLWRAPLLGGP